MLKKSVSIVLITAIILSLLSLCGISAGAETITSGDYEYESMDGRACIVKYNGNDPVVEIPFLIDGYIVTYIGEAAFENNDVREVIIPDTVTAIDDFAFINCENLNKVTIPEGVLMIGDYAFLNCATLYEVHIPRSVKLIGQYAIASFYMVDPSSGDYVIAVDKENFVIYGYKDSAAEKYAEENGINFKYEAVECGDYEYTLLEDDTAAIVKYYGNNVDLYIPEKLDGYVVSVIGKEAFSNCTGIKTVHIPSGVKTIEQKAFYSCTSLREVYFSEGLELIGPMAFGNCDSLKELRVPRSLKHLWEYAFGFYDVISGGSWSGVRYPDFKAMIYSGGVPQEYCDYYDIPYSFYLAGDADCDGVVSVIDATVVQYKLAELAVTDRYNEISAIVTPGQTKLSVTDAAYIQRYASSQTVPDAIGKPIPLEPGE